MSIQRNFGGAAISKPGAYTSIKVQNLTGFPLQPTGIVGIIGEAVGGEPGIIDELSGPAIQAAKDRYKSGPIKDALGLLSAPSNDARIANGASKIVVLKVNPSTQASLDLNNNFPTPGVILGLKSKNYGDDENGLNLVVAEGTVADADAKILGTIDGPFNMTGGGQTLILKINGTTYTYTTTLSGAAETATAVETDLNTVGSWAPSKPIIATTNGNKVDITLDSATLTSAALDYGYILVDPASTADTIFGLAGSNRGVKGSRFFTLIKGSVSEDADREFGGVGIVSVAYAGAGTSALLKIEDSLGARKFTVTVAGAPSDDLDLTLGVDDGSGVTAPRMTVKELVDRINANVNYTATVVGPNPDLNATELDYYTDVEIIDAALVLKRDIQDTVDYLNVFSGLVNAERKSNVAGAIATFGTAVNFTGGTDGTAANSDWLNALAKLEGVRVNEVVPLISADKGSVSIDTINVATNAHMRKMWSVKGRSERNGYVSKQASKADLKDAARALNSELVSILGQDTEVLSESAQALTFLPPWATACLVAGLQAGSEVGEPTTFKFANCNGLRVKDGSWDPKVDFDEMIEAGVTFLEPVDAGGFRVVVGNTTYSKDGSFVYNRVSVVEAAGFVAFDLRQNLEAVFTGTKAKTGSAGAIANFITARTQEYLDADVIVGDDNNDGKGFKDLTVVLEGNTAAINITITPVQGIDFMLPTIYLADIRQSA